MFHGSIGQMSIVKVQAQLFTADSESIETATELKEVNSVTAHSA